MSERYQGRYKDGYYIVIDTYQERSLADGYVAYQNRDCERDSFGNYDPSDALLDHLDNQR